MPENINRREYAWSNIELSMLGSLAPIEGFRAIEYTEKTNHGDVMARGAFAHSAVVGNTTFEGSITLLQSEVNAIMAALPASKRYITRIPPFNINVSYIGEDNVVVTDRLIGCRFKESKIGSKQGDLEMEIQLGLAILDIKYGV
jgi:hypothetical protein